MVEGYSLFGCGRHTFFELSSLVSKRQDSDDHLESTRREKGVGEIIWTTQSKGVEAFENAPDE